LAGVISWFVWRLGCEKRDIVNYIPILCYHRVLPDFIETNPPIYTILPEQFESQMAFLANEGFKSLSLSEYAGMALGLLPLEKRSVLITFDDGYADNYAIAWHICKKYNIKLNLFICTGYLGGENPIIMTENGYLMLKRSGLTEILHSGKVMSHIKKFPELWRPLTWGELKEMINCGIEIGFHSHLHHNYAFLRPDEISRDVATGLGALKQHLGCRSKFIALPYGGYESYIHKIAPILKSHDLDFVFTNRFGRALLPAEQMVFPRMSVHQRDNLFIFHRKLLGAYDWLKLFQTTDNLIGWLFRGGK